MAGGRVHKLFMQLVFLSFVILNMESAVKASRDKPKVLIISFDGFRYNYFDTFQPPNFVKFAQSGVRAKYGMKASFPTKTFPNHYTLATGLYPESHGIVDNSFYDDVFKEVFKAGKTDTKWFDAGEPIWITARLQGLKTAAYFWFGSETTIKNTTATHFEHYDKTVPWNKRIETVVDWLDKEDVSLALLYFEEPDSAGHKNGSFSEGVRIQLEKLDKTLGDLLQKLETRGLRKNLDIILLSDHGMTNVSQIAAENLILNQVVDIKDINVYQFGAVSGIYPVEGKSAEELRDKLNAATKNVKVYLKGEVPEEFHYRNNRRIAPLVAIAEDGFQTMGTVADLMNYGRGNHGYNNSLNTMWPFFMASGPSFKSGVVFDQQFENVNIYPLLCHLLDVKPSPNNGSINNILFLLDNNSALKFDLNVNLLVTCMLGLCLKTMFDGK